MTTGTMRLDEDLALFAQRQLTQVVVKAQNRVYPDLKIANGDILPVKEFPELRMKETVEIAEYDLYGIAKVVVDYGTDFPTVGAVVRRQSYNIKDIGAKTHWSWKELQQSRSENVPLEAKRLEALRAANDRKINVVGFDGDADYGLPGLFTSQIPRQTAASTFAAAASADALKAIVDVAVRTVKSNTNSTSTPAVIVMPQVQLDILGDTMRSTNSDITVLQAIKQGQAAKGINLEFIEDNNLKGKGTNGEDVMLVLPYDEEKICFGMAMDFSIPPELTQWINAQYQVHALSRILGVMAYEPLSGLIVEGI